MEYQAIRSLAMQSLAPADPSTCVAGTRWGPAGLQPAQALPDPVKTDAFLFEAQASPEFVVAQVVVEG